MATPTTTLLPFFNDNVIDAMTNGSFWRLDASRTIQFGVANGLVGERWPDPKGTADVLTMALQNVSSYANVKFSYQGIFGNPLLAYKGGADIVLTLSSSKEKFPTSDNEGQGIFPAKIFEQEYTGQAGDITVNMNAEVFSQSTFAPGSYGYNALLHEIGHTLGLKHPHDAGGTGRPLFKDLGISGYDQLSATVMSYNDDFSDVVEKYHPATFMIMDVLALQALYGKNDSTNSGNNQYYITNSNVYQTIWDAGGTDLVDASGGSTAWTIVLPNMRPSKVVTEAVGYALPSSEVGKLPSDTGGTGTPTTLYWFEGNVENATGSLYADTIGGNDLSNRLNGGGGNDTITGGAGNDTIDGGAGIDIASYSGSRASATISRQGDAVAVRSAEGTDTLTNVERLLFSDQLIALDANGNAGQGYRLYQAAFARTPDKAGLSFWVDKLDDGTTLRDVAAGFVSSAEFVSAYGRSAAPGQYVDKFYQNVLGRPGEAAGITYWAGELSRGVPLAEILVSFSESAENVSRLSSVIGQGISLDYGAFV